MKYSDLRVRGILPAHMYTETASSAPVRPVSSSSNSRLFCISAGETSTNASYQPPAKQEP